VKSQQFTSEQPIQCVVNVLFVGTFANAETFK